MDREFVNCSRAILSDLDTPTNSGVCVALEGTILDSPLKGSLANRTGDTRSALKLSILAIRSEIGSEEVGARLYQSSLLVILLGMDGT